MTHIRFLGFSNGSRVEVTAAQNNVSRGPVIIPSWKEPVGPGGYNLGDWSISNGGGGTNAIITITNHPADAVSVQYDIGATGTPLNLGNVAGSYIISGLNEGQTNSIRLRAVSAGDIAGDWSAPREITPIIISNGQMTAASWMIADEPSPVGNTAAVTILAAPVITDREIIGYEIETNGLTVTQVPLGHYPTQMDLDLVERPLKHMVRVPTSSSNIRIRPILRQVSPPGSNSDRLVERGEWSEDTKTVTPTIGSPSLTIQATRTTIRQHEGVIFRAILSGSGAENQFAEPHFDWIFGDNAAGTFSALASDFPFNTDANTQLGGWTAAHVFRSTGTKTVTCTAHYAGQTVTATVVITVNAWVNNIVYIASDGTGDYTSMTAAFAALPPNTERQYLLKRNNVFADDRVSSGVLTNSAPILIGTYGSGPKPIVTDTLGRKKFRLQTNAPMVIMDIDLRGKYIVDPVSSNTGASPGSAIDVNATSSAGFTCWGIEAQGYNESISGSGNNLIFANCKITDWYNFAFGSFGDSGNFAIIGTSARQNPLVYNDEVPKSWQPPYTALHGPHRTSRIDGVNCYYAIDLASFNSWSGDRSHQPCFRWGTGGEFTEYLIEAYFGAIRMEGGSLGTSAGTSGAKIYSAAKLWDRIDWVSTTQSGIGFGHGGEIMRNIKASIPNTPPEGGSLNRLVGMRLWTSTRIEEPVYLENATILDLRSQANAPGRSFSLTNPDDPRAALLNVSNLVLHAPNGISDGPTGDLPLDMSSLWTPLYLGRRITTENGGATQTQFAISPSDAPVARPLNGSAAIGSATSNRIPYRDFFGTVRPANPSRGAVEPV